MARILGACVFVVALGVLLALIRPSPTLSDGDLTAAVAQAYFPRTEDPALHELAHVRAVEISTDFSHAGMVTAEVLAWNQGFADPVAQAVSQWQGSPTHDSLLRDPTFNLIGCGSFTTDDGRYFAACLLGSDSPPPQVVVPAPPAEVPTVIELPNTALETP